MKRTKLVRLASRCLWYEQRERPNAKSLVLALTSLQRENEVPSYVLMDIPHGGASSLESLSRSPLGDACFTMDLTVIHEILETIGHTDDEGTTNELSFQMWTNQMQETLDSEKKGDTAFRQKDFSTAIDCYTQALVVSPTWPTAFYLQAAALFALGKENEAQEALKDGSSLEVKEKLLAKTDV